MTADIIAEQQAAAKLASYQEVCPAATDFEHDAAIDQAMRAYAMDFLAKRKAQRNVQPQLDTASPSKQKERSRQKGRER